MAAQQITSADSQTQPVEPSIEAVEVPFDPAEVHESAEQGQAVTTLVSIPRLTPIYVEVLTELSSNENATGDVFPIQLAEAIVIDGVEVIPAGTSGMGEVIHAKESGGMGAAGELILTGRYLDFEGQQIPLRSFRIDAESESRIGTVNAIAVASAVSIAPVALIGFFIKGGSLTIGEGTWASAKIASDVEIEMLAGLVGAETEELEADAELEEFEGVADTAIVEMENGEVNGSVVGVEEAISVPDESAVIEDNNSQGNIE